MTSCVTTLSYVIAFGVIAPRHRFIVCSYKCNISVCASNLSGPQCCTFVFCSGRNETIKLEGSKEKETLNLGSTNPHFPVKELSVPHEIKETSQPVR